MNFTIEDFMALQRAQRVRFYRELNRYAQKGQTVLAGSSLCENFPVGELLMSRGSQKVVYNRGISGTTIAEYSEFLDTCIFELEPSKLIINIGSNDLNLPGDTVGNLITGYRSLLQTIREKLPDCQITLLAYYPCLKAGPSMPPMEGRIARTQENVLEANRRVEALAGELGLAFYNLNAAVAGPDGYLDPAIALDDIHFSPAGYARVLDLLEPLL